MPSFFKQTKTFKKPLKNHSKRPSSDSDEEMNLSGIDEMNLIKSDAEDSVDGLEYERLETAEQKRLRLAKLYLEKIKEQVGFDDGYGFDAAQIDRELIAGRLEKDLDQLSSKFTPIAHLYSEATWEIRTFTKGHNSSVTSVAFATPSERIINTSISSTHIDSNQTFIYSTSKDASIVKWDLQTGKKLNVVFGGLKPTKKIKAIVGEKKLSQYVGHSDIILCCAVSSDGQFLATGGCDKVINIWSVIENKRVGQFKQHRDTVTGLVFKKGSNQLYSSSADRSIKVWNVDELSYIETLFGHQDSITDIASLNKERCVTSGGRDRTLRLWKIPEESQLIFRSGGAAYEEDLQTKEKQKVLNGSGGTVDSVSMLDDELFVSGSDSGSISLWSVNKKKPVFTRLRCHGDKGLNCWISSLESVPYTDIFASGSSDGFLKLWKVTENKNSFAPLFSIPIEGFINSLSFKLNETDIDIAIAVGQEHRLGRWFRCKDVKNCVKVIKLLNNTNNKS